jgi:diguanylate cyclase (GGDEF)-like protein
MSREKTKLFSAVASDMAFYTHVMIVVCFCGVSFGIPFAIYHVIWGEAIIALVLLPVVAVQLFALNSLIRNGYSAIAALTIAVLQTAGSSYFAIELGLMSSYWLFASGVANYYIVDRRIALPLNVLAGAIVASLAFDDASIAVRYVSSFAMINVFLFGFSRQLEKKNLLLDKMLTIDPLTLAGNRTALEDSLRRVKSQFDRYQVPVTVIMIDLDHFKRINDTFGHSQGDKVLQEISGLIRKRLRDADTLYRFGGEEFIIIAENTSLNQAAYLAEDIRRMIASSPGLLVALKTEFDDSACELGSQLTVSMGVAQLRQEETADNWVNRADKALYKAKSVGRNWVCFDAEKEDSGAADEVAEDRPDRGRVVGAAG